MSAHRSRWAAVGAAVAVSVGAASGVGLHLARATEPARAATFVAITPCRLLDTRPASDNVGARSTPIGPNEAYTLEAFGDHGNCRGIPVGAVGLNLNVTAVTATQPTFVTVYPDGVGRPLTSNLNPVPAAPPTPNAVTTDLSTTGRFDIYNLAGQVNVIVDVTGYYVDHDHDDRYYTKAEVDDITRLVPIAAGFVQSDATLDYGVGVDSVVFVDNPTGDNTDHYEITLTGVRYNGISYATLVTASCPGADGATVEHDGKLWVFIEVIGGAPDTLGACGFAFTVTALPRR